MSVRFRRHHRNFPDSGGFSNGTPVAILHARVGTHHRVEWALVGYSMAFGPDLGGSVVNAGGANGLFYGNAKLDAIQALAVAAVLIYSFVVTYGLLKAIDKLMGLRVSREDEMMALDLPEHGEAGYNG